MGTGFRTYFRAVTFIFEKGLWWTLFVPLVLNIALLFAGISLAGVLAEPIKEKIMELTGLGAALPALSHYLGNLVSGLLGIFLNIAFFFLFAYIGGYLVLIILSPLFAWLSCRTDEIITGRKLPFDLRQYFIDILRGILIVLRNLVIQTFWMIVLFFIGFIPVIGWLGGIVLFFINAYFYGFSFLDYTSERRKMSIGRSVHFVRTHRGLAIANGTVFSLTRMIPFFGIMLSGFAGIVATVGATLAFIESEKTS